MPRQKDPRIKIKVSIIDAKNKSQNITLRDDIDTIEKVIEFLKERICLEK